MNNLYPYYMNGMSPDTMQSTPGSSGYMDQDNWNPYRMTGNMYGSGAGLSPLQMSGIDEEELTPYNMSDMYGMQQSQNPFTMDGMQQGTGMQQGQSPYDIYGSQQGMDTSGMYGMQQGGAPSQMSSQNPYPMGMNPGQMGGSSFGNNYTYTPATPYGPQYGYSPQEGFKPQFMQGQGSSGYGSGLPYGPYQVGPTEGYYAPGPPYAGGSPSQGYGMPGPFGMNPGAGRRFFW
ncbi:hypothetical protein ACOJQI_10165 [Bacillus salacetis]|uniref:hypothetical protein n=1 Tax=Bacillus salacetis TaxID=2315464 RepID=UPI003BA163A3